MSIGHGSLFMTAGQIKVQVGLLIKRAWDSEGSKELRLLVTGKTGEGKSTLVNGLLGANVAVEGAGSERCTTTVEEYRAEIEGVPITVFDSPGLQDVTEKENVYLEGMRKKCQNLSLVLYCTKMINHRLKDEDKHAILKLTAAFGQKFWKYAILVLTSANKEDVERRDERDEDEGPEPDEDDDAGWKVLMKKRFEGRLEKWKNGFYKFLIEEVGVQKDIVERIPVVPAGDHRKTRTIKEPYRLPDRDDWFKDLWMSCILRVKGMKLFLQISKSRIIIEDEYETDTEVTAEEEVELPQEAIELFKANENIQEPPDAQDSTLQLTDTPSVDETRSAKLQENIKKMDKEAWAKEQAEKKVRKEREEVERQAEERIKEIERQAEERRKESEREAEERRKEIERQAEEERKESERQAEERRKEIEKQENERQAKAHRKRRETFEKQMEERKKEIERQAEERRKESEREAEERRKEIEREAEERRKESERQAEERRKEIERQAEERRKESERKAEERRKESERQAEERRKESERQAEERRKEIERQADKRRKEIERQAEERRKEIEKQIESQESDITKRKIALSNTDVKEVVRESLIRAFGEVISNASGAVWKYVTKPFRWFISLFY